MATSTHQHATHTAPTSNASPRAVTATEPPASANEHAVLSTHHRHATPPTRPRKRAFEPADGAKQGKDRHGGTRVLERDKRARTEVEEEEEQEEQEQEQQQEEEEQQDRHHELRARQAQYEESVRLDLAVVQDTQQRVVDVLAKIEQLQRAGSVTAHELQTFRQEYNRQIDAVLEKVDALADASSQRAALSVDAVTAEEIHQLRDELAICKDELTEMEPRRASVENEFFQRMERFSNQLDHVRLQMSKMEQDLLQENAVSRRSLENLVSRQMTQYRHAQSAENKRLRDEMDELRSDMCELLKEMHLLKERTKYLGREPRRGAGPSPGLAYPGYPTAELHHANGSSYSTGCTSYLYAPPARSRVPVHGDDELYCQHHHCPAGIPHGHAGVAHGPPIDPREPSPPRRLTKSALLHAASQAAPPRMPVAVVDRHDLPRFCPSPHYSSRSSSVSGRISATRDEHAQADDEQADDKEIERRLLEKHRLFWISEGAGSVSIASLEPPTAKFPDEE